MLDTSHTLDKSFTMDCAHELPQQGHKCQRLHGHTYTVLFRLQGEVQDATNEDGEPNPQRGFVLDYALFDRMKQLVDFFDHRYLNAYVRYPSAENLATLFAVAFANSIGTTPNIGAVSVGVSETPRTYAYSPWLSSPVVELPHDCKVPSYGEAHLAGDIRIEQDKNFHGYVAMMKNLGVNVL